MSHIFKYDTYLVYDGHCWWLRQYQPPVPMAEPFVKLLIYTRPMKWPTRVGLRSCDNFGWFQPQAAHVTCLGCRSRYIRIHKNSPLLMWLGEWIIIQGFPEIIYPSSNWGGYLHCSHGWCNRDWQSQQLVYFCTPHTGSSRAGFAWQNDRPHKRS